MAWNCHVECVEHAILISIPSIVACWKKNHTEVNTEKFLVYNREAEEVTGW